MQQQMFSPSLCARPGKFPGTRQTKNIIVPTLTQCPACHRNTLMINKVIDVPDDNFDQPATGGLCPVCHAPGGNVNTNFNIPIAQNNDPTIMPSNYGDISTASIPFPSQQPMNFAFPGFSDNQPVMIQNAPTPMTVPKVSNCKVCGQSQISYETVFNGGMNQFPRPMGNQGRPEGSMQQKLVQCPDCKRNTLLVNEPTFDFMPQQPQQMPMNYAATQPAPQYLAPPQPIPFSNEVFPSSGNTDKVVQCPECKRNTLRVPCPSTTNNLAFNASAQPQFQQQSCFPPVNSDFRSAGNYLNNGNMFGQSMMVNNIGPSMVNAPPPSFPGTGCTECPACHRMTLKIEQTPYNNMNMTQQPQQQEQFNMPVVCPPPNFGVNQQGPPAVNYSVPQYPTNNQPYEIQPIKKVYCEACMQPIERFNNPIPPEGQNTINNVNGFGNNMMPMSFQAPCSVPLFFLPGQQGEGLWNSMGNQEPTFPTGQALTQCPECKRNTLVVNQNQGAKFGQQIPNYGYDMSYQQPPPINQQPPNFYINNDPPKMTCCPVCARPFDSKEPTMCPLCKRPTLYN